jgi:two-component system, OmpR family, sensor histidine kinase VanS
MKLSLQARLFMIVSGLILFFILLSWLLNSTLLDKYYLYNKKNSLIDTYRRINSQYKGDPEEIALDLERLESTKGLQISILNSEYDVLYSSGGLGRNTRMMRPQRRDMPGGQSLSDMLLKNRGRQLMPGEMVFENSRDFRLNSIFIQFLSPMNNGDLLYLVTPVEAIEESVQIANQFFLFTGLLTIVIGTLLVYYITGKFTKPILKLNSITKKMAVLEQVLMNYISNAVNHVDYLKRICISLEQRDDKARIKVFNSGSPIPEDSMDKIWTSFYKVDKARTRAYGGTGLGLSIVRAVQEAHKNGYGVNNVDGGVEFWFELDIIDEMGESA